MLSVQECKTEIVKIIDRLPDSKIEELLDYASFLGSRYSTSLGSMGERTEDNINKKGSIDYREEYMDIFGVWSKEELEGFNKATDDFRKIDPAVAMQRDLL
jgi:hypothetical protein